MNRFFWTWLVSGALYALGITVVAITNSSSVMSAGYISNELFQIGALLMIYYACNLIDNIPHNLFALKYGVIMLLFFIVYGIAFKIDQSLYLVTLIFKLMIVVMIIYAIIVKWRFNHAIKIVSIIIFGLSGSYLSFYDFLLYGSRYNARELSVYMCVGIIMLALQNINFAILYRMHISNRDKLEGDYLSIFAENSADIIFYYNLSPYPRFSFVSPASNALLGYSPQNFYSNNKLHLEIAVEEDREAINELFSNFTGDNKSCKIKAERKDSEIIDLECYATKVKINGRAVAVEGVLRDVTEKVHAEKKIIENNKNRQLMLSYISHELKTPITYIIGYSDAILKNIITAESERRAAVESIYNKADSLAKLVEDISMLSKLETSSFSYDFEEISCLELADQIREICSEDVPLLKDKNQIINGKLDFKATPDINGHEYVLADRKRLNQVFENILSNAIKATDDDRDITVDCRIEKNKMKVSVTDNGPGISDEDIEHIFDNFYRGQMKKKYEGSGLGLSLSRQIMRGHSGDLTAASRQGAGTTMTVTIPLFKTQD